MKSKKWLISVGLAVVLVAALALTGCPDPDPGDPVKRLDIGTVVDVDNLYMDPSVMEQTNIGCLYSSGMVYESFAIYTKAPPGEEENAYDFTPRLAVDYTITTENRLHPVTNTSQEAQVWTWELREDVKWHDGEPFTAYDVEYTFENVLSPWDPAKPLTWDEYPELEWWINVVDDHTIELIYENPLTTAHIPAWMHWEPIVPKHVFGPDGATNYPDDWNADPLDWDGNGIGTGPFKLQEYKSGQHHHWVRNDDWWGKDVAGLELPEIEEIWIRIYDAEATMLLGLEGGDIDVMMGSEVPPDVKDAVDALPDVSVTAMPGITNWYLAFNFYTDDYYVEWGEEPLLEPDVNPMHDLALRQAIAYAIDVDAAIDITGWTGLAEAIDSWVYKESPNHNPDLELYEFDDDAAEAILTAANYTKNGDGWWVSPYTDTKLELNLGTVSTGNLVDMATLIREQLRDFGLDVTLELENPSVFLGSVLYAPMDHDYDMLIYGEDPSLDPWSDWIWMLLADPWDWGYQWSPTFWFNADYNDLFWELYYTVDKQATMFDIQQLVNDELPMYMLVRFNFLAGYRTDRWTNWQPGTGGMVVWSNPHSLLELQWVGG